MQPGLTRALPREWHSVREIRSEVDQALADVAPDLRQGAVITASELVENAVKYGESVPGAVDVGFSMEASDQFIRVEVTNGATNGEAVRELQECIKTLSATADLEQLYFRRLQEIVDALDETTGKLGLFRIAFEAGFGLECTYKGDVVTVRATKGLV